MAKETKRPTKDLWDLRVQSILKIAGFAGGSLVFSGAPKPGAEIPSHIVLTGADFVMCGMIYHDYFGRRITQRSIVKTLGMTGLFVAITLGGGTLLAKGATGAFSEVANFLGPLGWMASGLLAAGSTGVLGLVWLFVVDSAYRNNDSVQHTARAMA
jgi:hypothetical protein